MESIHIAKLYAYGFSKDALHITHSYLSNRWQRTKIADCFSSCLKYITELLQRVPQGSVLGSDVCSYADDTTLYSSDKDLESVLQRLQHDSMNGLIAII